MSRLLSGTQVTDRPHRLDAPRPVLDDATRELLAQAEAAGYARGRVDGAADAANAAAAAAAQVAGAVEAALDHARVAWTDVERRRARDMIDTARQMATAVLAHEPRADGELVLQRLAQAAQQLDHGPFTIHVSGADHEVVAAGATALPTDTDIRVDPNLAPGDARITGPWSQADLTLEAMLDVVSQALVDAELRGPEATSNGPLAVHRMEA